MSTMTTESPPMPMTLVNGIPIADEPDKIDPFASLESYLATFSPSMAHRLSVGVTPLFDPERDSLSAPIQNIIAEDGPFAPLPAQAAAAEAIVREWREDPLAIAVGEMGSGKAQPLDAKVLTPNGWKRMGDLQVDDELIDQDGGTTHVLGIYPQGVKEVFRVTMTDGAQTECCAEHLWDVRTPLQQWRGADWNTRELQSLVDSGLHKRTGEPRFRIPMMRPAEFRQPETMPVDPYVLGVLLGDGALTGGSVVLSNPDQAIRDAVAAAIAPVSIRQKSDSVCDYWLTTERGQPNPLLDALRSLGIMGCRSEEKFIPTSYLYGTVETRLAVLRGLCDTDGSASGVRCEYCTSSAQLAADVTTLVQSLGGIVHTNVRECPSYTYKGERRTGQTSYRLTLKLPTDLCPFLHSAHKRDALKPITKYPAFRSIDSVEPIGQKPCQCIHVASATQRYVTDDFIVTHNTLISLWAVRALSERMGRPVRVVLTAPNQLVRKWKRMAEQLIPGCDARIVKSFKDVRKLAARRTLTGTRTRARHEQLVYEWQSIERDRLDLLRRAKEAYDNGDYTQASSYKAARLQVVEQMKLLSRTMARVKPGARWNTPEQNEIWILPRDRGKLGYAWRACVNDRKHIGRYHDEEGNEKTMRLVRFHCPKCGNILRDDEGEPCGVTDFVNQRGKLKRRRKCRYCEEPLWQAHNGRTGPLTSKRLPLPGTAPRRMAPYEMLKLMGARFDVYIPDEVHELKGGDTIQGRMFGTLCNLSDHLLLLTGTLTGGYAENLLHILWRTMPHQMIADGQDFSEGGHGEFVKRYGVLQTERRYTCETPVNADYEDLKTGKGNKRSTRTKSLPGISPLILSRFLFNRSIFIRLAQMSEHLPGFIPTVHEVPMDAEQDAQMQNLQRRWEDYKSQVKQTRAWSSIRHAMLRLPDKPHVDPYWIWDQDEHGNRFRAIEVHPIEKRERPKERKIRELIEHNISRGRKTWVFTELSGTDNIPRWDWMAEFAEYLRAHNIRATVLRTEKDGGPKPENREKWIADHAGDVDVVMSNPNLVQTGLDLFDFPSIIFAFCGDKTYVLRQASRRAWRLGQQYDCEVDYIVYQGEKSRSVQAAALSLMAKKMESSLAIEGDFSSDALAAMSDSEDIASKLARFIDGKLDEIEPVQQAFSRYRQRLEECMPEITRRKADEIRRVNTEFEHGSHHGSQAGDGSTRDERTCRPAPTIDRKRLAALEQTRSLLEDLGLHDQADQLTADPHPPEAPKAPEDTHEATEPPEAPESARPPKNPKAASGGAGGAGAGGGGASGGVRADVPQENPSDDGGDFRSMKPGDRKRLALAAVCHLLDRQADESDADRHRFGSTWLHVTAKNRQTVRARNFADTAQKYADARIVFVEHPDEVGPTTCMETMTINDVEVAVSTMPVADYMQGDRVSRSPAILREVVHGDQ